MFAAGAVGPVVPGWQGAPVPGPEPMAGRFVTLERLRPDHAPALWQAIAGHYPGLVPGSSGVVRVHRH